MSIRIAILKCFGQAAQIFAAKERREHKKKKLPFCVLCVLLWLSSLVAAWSRYGASRPLREANCCFPGVAA